MKIFRIPAAEIKQLATGLGSCIASDRITVDGMQLGYMHREAPCNNTDSGWRFFAGDEADEYTADPNHFAIHDVNTIANYEPMITSLLETPAPCAFARGVASPDFIAEPPPTGEPP